MVRLTFLEKKFDRKYRLIQEFFKSHQTRCGVSHVYLECKTKRIFAIACLGKQLGFHTEYCDYFECSIFNNFENASFWLGLRVYQIKPNLVWPTSTVGRLWNKKNFWYSLLRKKVSFSFGNVRLFQISNFKNRSFWDPNQAKLGVEYPMCTSSVKQKEFSLLLVYEKVRFSYGILRLFRIFDFK